MKKTLMSLLIICGVSFLSTASLAQGLYHPQDPNWQGNTHSPNAQESGMAPYQVDLKRREENAQKYSEWYQKKEEQQNVGGFFKVEKIDKGCIGFVGDDLSVRSMIIEVLLPKSCDVAYKYRVKMQIYCDDESDFVLPVTARGKKFYWSLKDVHGSTLTNEMGVIELTFLSAESFSIQSELKLYLDEARKQEFKVAEIINMPVDFCLRKSKNQ